MPHWLTEILDVDHPDILWQPPAKLPTIGDLRDAIQRCDLTLEGQVTPSYAKQCFAKLVMAFEPNAKLSGDETRLRVAVWIEACGDMNDALWSDATTQAIQGLKWMPKPAEFRALVAPQIDQAKKRKARLREMLDRHSRPPEAPAFEREPMGVRLRTMRDGYRRTGNLAKAAGYERDLARHEGRPTEEWATTATAAPAPPSAALTPPRPVSPEMQREMLKCRIEFFRDMGFLDYVARMEAELAAMPV